MAYYGSLGPHSDERRRKARGRLTRFSIRRFRCPEGFCPSLASRLALWTDWPEPGLLDIVWSNAVGASFSTIKSFALCGPYFAQRFPTLVHAFPTLVPTDANTINRSLRWKYVITSYLVICVFVRNTWFYSLVLVSLIQCEMRRITGTERNCGYKLW